MASNLRVDSIVPATSGNVSIGTATGGVNIPGVLTYEDVTNVDSVGVITARSGINITSGRLLLGTTTEGNAEYDDLTIATSGHTGITIRSGTSNEGAIAFSDGTSGADEYRGLVQYNHSNNYLRFLTDATERLRVDSSGRMFLGLTSSSFPKRLNIQGSSGAIIALNNNDTTSYAADTNTSLELALNTGNTGNQNGACEIRAFKQNGTNGNNARGLSFYTGTNGGSPTKRLVVHPEGWVEKTNQISLARYGNSNLSISNNTQTVLSHFGSLGYETGGGDSYWGSNKFTCPVAGMYMVYVKINLNANTGWGHDAYLAIRKNGTTGWFSGGNDVWYDLLGANSEYYRGLFTFMNVPCAVNDEIDFTVRQNSGSTRTLYGTMCYFNIYHLG